MHVSEKRFKKDTFTILRVSIYIPYTNPYIIYSAGELKSKL